MSKLSDRRWKKSLKKRARKKERVSGKVVSVVTNKRDFFIGLAENK